MSRSKKDVIAGSVLSLLAVFYLIASLQIKRTNIDRVVGSRLFPQICGVLLLVLSLSLVVNGMQKLRKEREDKRAAQRGGAESGKAAAGKTSEAVADLSKPDYRKTAAVLVSFVLYIILMGGIGFAPASVLYLFSQMVIMGKPPYTKKKLLLYAVIAAVVSAVVFVLFNHVFLLMLPKAGWF